MSTESDPAATHAERAAKRSAFAARARSRAEQRLVIAQVLIDRAMTARRLTQQATARVTGRPIREAPFSSDG